MSEQDIKSVSEIATKLTDENVIADTLLFENYVRVLLKIMEKYGKTSTHPISDL